MMGRPTTARINLSAVAHNVSVVRALVGRRSICAAVKADAYGHGAPVISHAMEMAGVDSFGVAMTEEALDLRYAGIHRPILLLSAVPGNDIEAILDHDLTPGVAEVGFAGELSRRAVERHQRADVHVNVDTGMHRVGVDWETAAETILGIADLPGLRVAGVFSHFAAAEADDLSFSREQVRRFRCVLAALEEARLKVPLVHMANSSGVLRLPEAYFDGVRPGLIMYGLTSREDTGAEAGLRPVLSLCTRIGHLKRIRRGEKIGYGLTFECLRDSLIATVPIGYHDGYIRPFSNVGEMLVRGRRVPVVGRVCMDQTLLDVTDVPDVAMADEAVVYGRQGGETLGVTEMAARVGRIPQELTCALGRRVRREFVLDGMVVVESPFRSVVPETALRRVFANRTVAIYDDTGAEAPEAGTA